MNRISHQGITRSSAHDISDYSIWSFAISRKKPALLSGRKETMEAYLGSCVGVTLKDDQAELGGLIHILLPEPTGTDIPFGPAVYATTGLPLFIDELCGAGAPRDNLSACIAGGALVGRISEQDLLLDVGGKTSEMVKHILLPSINSVRL